MNGTWILLAGMAVLLAGNTVASALNVGDRVPEVSVPSTSGAEVNVGAVGGGWKVVYFYPKSFTPGCTTQACSMRDGFAAYQDLGVTVYGVSTDKIEKQQEFKSEYKLPFELLADNEKKLSEAFGVMGMMGFSKRITFIINPEGIVTDIIDSVSVGSHDKDVIALLKTRLGK